MKVARRGLGRGATALLVALVAGATACTPLSDELTQRGITLAESGDVAGAERQLRQAIDADPQNAMAAYQLGALAENRADDFAARNWYRRAATRAKDRRVDENGEDVLLSVWALRGLERVNRRIAEAEGIAPEPVAPTADAAR